VREGEGEHRLSRRVERRDDSSRTIDERDASELPLSCLKEGEKWVSEGIDGPATGGYKDDANVDSA
jgi:hypothetical protein